jgi:neutral amino acid transport system ATP-binding protein
MPETTSAHPLADIAPEPGVAKPDPLLVADHVRRRFGGLVAVDVEHLEIQRGVITALIGPNGAGKTTLFNLLTGFDQPDTGTFEFDGQRMRAGTAPHVMARRGLVRTFQLTKALAKLTVMENMKLAAPGQRGERFLPALIPPLWRAQEQANEERAMELLGHYGMAHMRDEYAATLSGGQRKLLEMARALMVEPSLVMLDEPVAGVNPALTQSILDHVTPLPGQGVTVLFVEHDMDVVMGISDWVVCMAEGRIIAEGPPEAVGRNPAVVEAYLGTRRGAAAPSAQQPAAEDAVPEDGGVADRDDPGATGPEEQT